MLVVTNYPQVPIATTNAATESARVENQQRPPIIPAPQLAKSNQERAFNPQHERAAEQAETQAKLHERVSARRQGSEQQQGKQQQNQGQKHAASAYSSFFKPALKRQDIRAVNLEPSRAETIAPKGEEKPSAPDLPSSFYDRVSAHIGRFYQTQTHPRDESAPLAII